MTSISRKDGFVEYNKEEFFQRKKSVKTSPIQVIAIAFGLVLSGAVVAAGSKAPSTSPYASIFP